MFVQQIEQLTKQKLGTINSIDILRRIDQKVNSIKQGNIKDLPQAEILLQLLTSYSCQNVNLLHYQKFEEKHLVQKCMAYVEQILYQLLMVFQNNLREKMTELFIEHILNHPCCWISYLLFYKLNKRLNHELLAHLQYDQFKKINIKIIAHFQHIANQISVLHSLSKNSSFEKCQQNLKSYLKTQRKPHYNTKNPQQLNRPSNSKIPPLLLPLTKSIASSRYSYSRDETKRKGLNDLHRLAESLGEGFVSVQLGILLANKRTQQVKQFAQNSEFREKCIEKIQTERATSRLSMFDNDMRPFANLYEDQTISKNFKYVLTINGNLLIQKLERQDCTAIEPFLRQYLDIGFSDLIKLSCVKGYNQKVEFKQYGNQIKTILHSLQKILSILMQKCSHRTELSHLGQLLNRGKENSCYHYNLTKNESLVKDDLLEDIQAIKINKFKPYKGPLNEENHQKIVYEDFVIGYLHHYFKELFAMGDMNKSKFYIYEIKLLKLLGFYLRQSTSNTTKYLATEKMFEILLLIKRQILELSYPHLNSINEFQPENILEMSHSSNGKEAPKSNKKSLLFEFPQLFANYLITLSQLLTNNKHTERLFSSIFFKNIYFMETLQHFAIHVFEAQLVYCGLAVLEFFKAALKIFYDRKQRNQQSKTLKTIFQNIEMLINSNSGCLAKSLKNLQFLINPNDHSFIGNVHQSQQNELHYFFQGILKFVWEVYYYCDSEQMCSSLLEEETASYYIKFSMINFVKLYSSLTVTELLNAQINTSKQALITTKESPHFLTGKNVNQDYMIIFLKILSNISINRTPQISKKMRQYRILEFFVRQLELQFSVMDNIDKYIRKAKKTKDVPKKFYTQVSQKQSEKYSQKSDQIDKTKTIKIPSLNLSQTSKVKSDKQQKDSVSKGGKLNLKIPLLKIPSKNQQKSQQKFSQASQKPLFLQLTKLNLGSNQSERQGSQRAKTSQRHIIYFQQRKVRKIYSSKTLHSQCLLLVLSLVLYKGLLDPYYCDQFPITHGKTNILYILHFHLNHQSNRSVIPIIGELVTKIKPYLSGQRLLKLLTTSFTNLANYKNWKKINSGAYGVIYSCETNINEPKQVAIKQMNFPKSIYERCVLHDIFTEITCLENFRLDDRITKMYNYGVVDNTYVIVMKKYQCSLRQWILSRKEQLQSKHLPTVLTIYYDILKIVKSLHEQKVTHYDIKADNILLEIQDQKRIRAVFGDFGQCKIYTSDKDELDMKSRGTECIKSPEMLTLALQLKKEADHYDRRKKIGTTRASDVWSLGCLFYEILTGQFLFHRVDWVNFYVHVTSSNEELLTRQNLEKLGNNTVLVEFLKFMLIRDPHHRPSIINLIDKYEHLYALLVSVPPDHSNSCSKSALQFNQTLDNLLESYIRQISKKSHDEQYQQEIQSIERSRRSVADKRLNSINKPNFGGLMKIMNDIYYCHSEQYFLTHSHQIKKQGITHIISSIQHPLFNNIFLIKQLKKNCFYTTMALAFQLCPRISDILREVLLVKGKLLFVNDQTNYAVNLLIYTLSYWFRCSVYQTWCLINTQILLFPSLSTHLIKLSSSLEILNKIQNHIESLPKLQCICGSVTMILKKKLVEKKGQYRNCKCKLKPLYQYGQKQNNQGCPSLGCSNYLQFLKKRYCIIWDNIKWIETNQTYFLTTLFQSSKNHHKNQSSHSHTNNSKSRNNTQKDLKQPLINSSLRTQIILNSAEPYQNMLNCGSSIKGWKIYQCRVCEMWMLAINEAGKIQVIINNLIRRSRQGIMIPNAQQDFKMRTPALNYYTLSKLHMTSQ